VESETAMARMQVEHAETAIKQEQDEMRNADKVGVITTNPGSTFE